MPIDDLLNRAESRRRPPGGQPPPATGVAIVTCMDARIDPAAVFGLESGDAHVIRNAGGLATDDAERSVVISQRKLGTRAVLVVQHTKCGMQSFTDEDFVDELRAEAGAAPEWRPGTFTDLEESVRAAVQRFESSPFLVEGTEVRGFVYDVDSGELRKVDPNRDS